MRGRAGFSLLELVAVLLLLALLAGAVGWAVADRKHAVELDAVLERLAFVDRMARLHACQTGVDGRLEIDLDSGRIVGAEGRVSFVPPPGFALCEVRLSSSRSAGRRVEIPFAASGASPTYAVCVRGPRGQEKWLLFAGRTGQSVLLDDGGPADALLERVQ